MVDPVLKSPFRFFRKIDISPHKRIVEAEFSDLAVRDLFAVLSEQIDLLIELRCADGTCVVTAVDPEYACGKTAFAHGITVVHFQFARADPVGWFRTDEKTLEKGSRFGSDRPDIRWGQEGA